MATSAAKIEFVPDATIDFVPDDAAVEFIPDEVITQEAQRAATGATQALDVMGAPRQFDWSDVNEQLDAQRFIESQDTSVNAVEQFRLGQISEPELMAAYRQSDQIRAEMSPTTTAGSARDQRAADVATQAQRDATHVTTPSEMLSGFLGSGLSSTTQPVIESSGRSIGGAAGGALGAALAGAATVGTGGVAPLLFGIGGALLGSQAGGAAQEAVLRSTETEEETQRRQQRTADDITRNPGLSKLGMYGANLPFFGPSLAQFGRAAAGDAGAIANLGIAGTIGGSLEVLNAAQQGRFATAQEIAEGVFSNLILNEPTKLGRRIGLQPSTEQAAVEAAAKYEQAPIRIGGNTELESGLTQRGTTSTADVFAGVQKSPTGQGEDVSASVPVIVSTAINAGEGGLIRGADWNSPHASFTKDAIAAGWDMEDAGRGFIVRDPDGSERFVSRTDAYEIAGASGQRSVENSKGELNSQDLAAKPVKPEPPEAAPEATSIQNAVMAEERAARGISPAEEPAHRAFGEVWDNVKAEVADNPARPDALLAELRKKPRALTDREDALLLHRQIELQKSYDTAAAEVNRAAEIGDEPARADAMTRLNGARDALQDVYDIGKQAGTETGRGLNARKMMADQDFNLASMETRLRADQGGKLSEPQLVKVKEQAETIAKTQEGMNKILAEQEVLKAQAEADKAVDPRVKSLADRIIAKLDLTAKNAATSLRSRLKNLNQLVPDPGIIVDVAKIAAAKTAKGAIEFAQWSAEMVKDFGEKVRPFLQKGWEQREQYIDAEVSTIGGKTKKVKTEAEKEQAAIKARLTALANRTADLQARTAAGDFSPRKKAPLDLSKNPEWVRLKAENDAAKAAYEKSRYEARKAQRTTEQKVRDTIADVWGASRPILASTDISAPGRQGIFFSLPDMFLNPVRLGQQLRSMFRSQFSETKFQQNEAAIKSRENADLYESSDLYLADIDHKPSAREEQFKSELAEKIPGIGRIVRGSSRGFSAFMNTVRADAMDAFVKWSGGRDKVSPETANFLAAAINDLSGRGNVSSRQAQGALEWLAKYLFSPRLWVSRFNTALLKPVWRDPLNRAISPRARAVVLGQYAKFVGALLALKFLAGLNGGKMEEDPRDSDFGKLQFGSKRYDVMGGIGNMVTLLARISTQKTKDDKGKLLRIAWDDEKRPERELGQILFNHLRNKAAPVPGAVYDYIYGRHPDRSKVTPTSLLKQTTVPITVSDTVEMFQNDSPASALRDTLINSLGVSASDYSR
jgi:hypothetical protein